MIHIEQLRVAKNGRTICAVPALSVEPGERVAVLGANGSGKTTLLRVLAGLEKEFDGRCQIDVAPLERVYVHQAPYLFRGTVIANVTYGLRARGTAHADAAREATLWLDRLGMAELAASSAANLSGGELRRVALARALVLAPRLLLLDEPLAELDPEGEASVAAALDHLKQCTILVASPTELPPGMTQRDYRLLGTPVGAG